MYIFTKNLQKRTGSKKKDTYQRIKEMKIKNTNKPTHTKISAKKHWYLLFIYGILSLWNDSWVEKPPLFDVWKNGPSQAQENWKSQGGL